MSAPEEGKPHRETRHREDKPSKRRHPHGKRHQADADSRPITEADLDSEASSLQDDDDLVESLSRSSSRRTASSRNQPAQLAPGGPPPPTPITTKALSPANPAQTAPKATQQAYQPSGPPAPTPVHQPFPAQDHSDHSPPPTAADGAPRTTSTSLLDKWHFNVGGLNVSPSRSSSSSCARSCNASGHLDHHSWTDCLPCS